MVPGYNESHLLRKSKTKNLNLKSYCKRICFLAVYFYTKYLLVKFLMDGLVQDCSNSSALAMELQAVFH